MALTVTGPGAVNDTELKALLDMYRQVVSQRYTACPPEDIGRMLAAPPFFVSRKLDGELWFLVADTASVRLIAPNGRVVTGADTLLDTAEIAPGTVLAGELHVPRAAARERVGDVGSALADGGRGLAFGAFDLVRGESGTFRELPYPERLAALADLPSDGPVHAIPVITTNSEADVVGIYQDVVEKAEGEGIVVRCSDGRVLKVKPEITLDVVILGYTSRESTVDGPEVRSLLVGLPVGNCAFVPLTTIGNFNDSVGRSQLLEALTPLNVKSQYRRAASTGQLYQMVTPSVLIECRVLDVQVEDARGRPIRQPELRLVDGEWCVAGQARAATLLNGVILRLRDDKANVEDGARWAQIEPFVPAPGASDATDPSTVVRRQVWTKAGKDKTDVRKLVVWKTNKDGVDPSYPAYVVHWTDYSFGRKSPLTREVRPAPTLDTALSIADGMVADNIKKGWEERV